MASGTVYKKHFIPLESNPDLFTELIHRLGLSSDFGFHDVLSIDDPELLAFIPRPALALVLVFPTTATYDEHTRDEEQSIEDYAKSGSQEEVMWYKQTINNACGLYGILHAVSNGDAKDYVGTYKRSARINRIANSESG
jgi:ubiquitin carboxyl-terminal hydrolase L3